MTELTAGRELDALIAEKVMGWKLDYEFADYVGAPTVPSLRDQYDEWGMLPELSTDISAAWQVVEKMSKAWDFAVNRIDGLNSVSFKPDTGGKWITEYGLTASEAICLAALKAVEATQKEKT